MKRKNPLRRLVAVLLLSGSAALATSFTVPTGTYLMAFHACDTSVYGTGCISNPANHTTYVAESSDGANWTYTVGFPSYTGSGGVSSSVPDLIRKGDWLYIFNCQSLHKYNMRTGNIGGITQTLQVTDSSGNPVTFVDTSPILDSSGNLRIFFLRSSTTGVPGTCATFPCTMEIQSATSSNAGNTTYVLDSGTRVSITLTSGDPISEYATDPDVFTDGTYYYILVSRGNKVQAFKSTTIDGTYSQLTNVTDGIIVDGVGGVASGYHSSSGDFWIYVHSGYPAVIKRAVVSSLTGLTAALGSTDFTTVGSSSMNSSVFTSDFTIESPGFTEN